MLYIIGTPIGNLQDITLRALDILKQQKVIVVESYKDSLKLLKHFEIKPQKIVVYNDSNKRKTVSKILDLLKEGDVAYITSAGMPAISDPGADLANLCLLQQIAFTVIPGASAMTTALAACGMNKNNIVFLGFLPRKKGKIEKTLLSFLTENNLVVFYESPFRIKKTLSLIANLGQEISVFIGKELTKKFEQYFRGTAAEVLKALNENIIMAKGEFTVVLTKETKESGLKDQMLESYNQP